MKTENPGVQHLALIAVQLLLISAQSPPQLITNAESPRKVVTPGSQVTLPCPVHGDRDTLIFEWYKDKESLGTFADHRLRINPNGALRIKKTNPEDTGLYTCRAVNGFGSVEHNTTLIVLGGDEDYDNEFIDDELEEDTHPEKEDPPTHKISASARPYLLYVTEVEASSTLHQLPGSSVDLHCVAAGYPRPQVTWLKNGDELPQTVKRGRWSLRLRKMAAADAGNYTCLVQNALGSTSHSFLVDVSADISRGKPQLTGSHPSNTTVEEGNMAMLQCVVWSETMPQIEWLKRVEEIEMNQENIQKLIKVEGESFRVLESSPVMERPDGTFLNKLLIHNAQETDSGKYICLGANNNGYSFRSAFLTVLSRPTLPQERIPFPIVVTVTVLIVACVGGFVALLIYCRSRRPSPGGNSAEVPMVTKDAFLPLHRGPVSVPRCGSVACASSVPVPARPEVTMYVPSRSVRR